MALLKDLNWSMNGAGPYEIDELFIGARYLIVINAAITGTLALQFFVGNTWYTPTDGELSAAGERRFVAPSGSMRLNGNATGSVTLTRIL